MRRLLSLVVSLSLALPVQVFAKGQVYTPMSLRQTIQILKISSSFKQIFQLMDLANPKSGAAEWLKFIDQNDLKSHSFADVRISGNQFYIGDHEHPFTAYNDGNTYEYRGVKFSYAPKQSPQENYEKMKAVWGPRHAGLGRSLVEALLPNATARPLENGDEDFGSRGRFAIGTMALVLGAVVVVLGSKMIISKTSPETAALKETVVGFALLIAVAMAAMVWAGAAQSSPIRAQFRCVNSEPKFFDRKTSQDISANVLSYVNEEPRALIVDGYRKACAHSSSKVEKVTNDLIQTVQGGIDSKKLDNSPPLQDLKKNSDDEVPATS